MLCRQAEKFIMQKIEGEITQTDAMSLYKHVLECETCRELYLLLDDVRKVESVSAPPNFTNLVMFNINNQKECGQPVLAFSLLFFAIGFIIAFDPNIHATLPASIGPILSYFGLLLNSISEITSQMAGTLASTAMLLVTIMGTLLFVLHSNERVKI